MKICKSKKKRNKNMFLLIMQKKQRIVAKGNHMENFILHDS